ncbi:hypothetical protein ACIPW5_29460 [Streptomyces sp. NPDC090077]|uniref:hypothetical protein n=1 Tax=Streptomyces sp. NPDC090077 TaxID=3365938 RepID=UPI003810AA17
MARERIRWPLVVDRARELVDGYAPLKVPLRQVMYRLAAEGVLPHTPPMYRRLSARLAQARREGRFPDLTDTVRQVHVPPAWPSADAFVRQMPDWFRLDRTAGQEHALYVAAEKDTLRQQLTGWLESAGIPVLIVRGSSSQSYADVVRDRVAHEQRQAHLAVVGDYDPSGEHLFNALAKDVIAFAQAASAEVEFERVAVTDEQVTDYNQPTAPPKATDRRSFSGTATTQAEALPPDTLAAIVRQAVEAHRDPVVHQRTLAREEIERQAVRDGLGRG